LYQSSNNGRTLDKIKLDDSKRVGITGVENEICIKVVEECWGLRGFTARMVGLRCEEVWGDGRHEETRAKGAFTDRDGEAMTREVDTLSSWGQLL